MKKGDGTVVIEMTEDQFNKANANFKAKDSIISTLTDSLRKISIVRDSLVKVVDQKDERFVGYRFDMEKKLVYEKDQRIAELDLHYKRMTRTHAIWATICFPLLLVFARL